MGSENDYKGQEGTYFGTKRFQVFGAPSLKRHFNYGKCGSLTLGITCHKPSAVVHDISSSSSVLQPSPGDRGDLQFQGGGVTRSSGGQHA